MLTLGERDLSRLASTWMLGAEFRYMSWTTSFLSEHSVGFRVSAAYAVQSVALAGPTGKDLGKTRLHSLQTGVALSQEWAVGRWPAWAWDLDIGLSRFDQIQTGESNLAEASGDVWLATGRIGPSYRIGDFWMGLTYERRTPVSSGWARLDDSAVILGVHYGLR
ncbi:MAG: hypothetical protein HC902_09170 [Calothrix sp. SM1_5_4]|nr:hypothetical protein [Calothrix sp. SM1_5_4]